MNPRVSGSSAAVTATASFRRYVPPTDRPSPAASGKENPADHRFLQEAHTYGLYGQRRVRCGRGELDLAIPDQPAV